MFWHYSREGKHGLRAWWHFDSRSKRPSSVFHIEANWLATFCQFSIRATGDGWTLALAFPPVAMWFCFDGFGLWHPQYKANITWEDNREVWLPDQREFSIGMSDWTFRVTPWGRSMEWRSADPWWVRGVSFDFRNLLGRQQYTNEVIKADIPIQIPMPEGVYQAVAKYERSSWKRPLWFRTTRLYTTVDVPKGIPFAGKGENSWDCGDDGLFGYSVQSHDLEKAIARGVESVLKSRKRHGRPSPRAIEEALV